VLRPVRSDATTDHYEITQRVGRAEIVPGRATPVWGYEGIFPGPTIHARRGRVVSVRHTNRLDTPTVVHLHGAKVASDSDGFPTDAIAPGDSRTYVYPNDQPAATLWYHDHAMHATGRNVYMGLAGLYVIGDDESDELGLPSGDFDVPLLLQDRTVGDDGHLRYDRERNLGATGDLVLVNGDPQPRLTVEARRYRFRIVNGANSTVYRLALDSGRPLVQIATDGGLLPVPVESAGIRLAMAERIEIVVDFAEYRVGSRVILTDLAASGTHRDVMCFDVVAGDRDPSRLPDELIPFEKIALASAARARDFTFAGGPASFPPVAHWTVNGRSFDAARPIAAPRLGDVEVWRFVNRRRFGVLGLLHPVHVHLIRFQIIDRSGRAPEAYEAGWKDTVAVPAGEEVRVIARFDGHRGRYLIHCHNLEHEDHDMMARYDVV
jgi:spore coat protein A, manganese oxidase